MSQREAHASGGGLSLQTLLISSLAAVAAAAIVPMFWEKGSLFATAVTPVIVALVSEALKKPAKAISTVTPRVTRRTATGAAVRTRQPTGVGARNMDRTHPEGQVPGGISPADPFGLREAERPKRRLPVRIAVATGLLAALLGAGVVTASELALFNHSVGSSGHRTSLFGGKPAQPSKTKKKQQSEKASPTPQSTPSATPTPSATASPSSTPTPAESPTATPSAPTPSATTAPTP